MRRVSNLEIPPRTKGRILVAAERSVNKGFSVREFKKDNYFNNLWWEARCLAEAAERTEVDSQIGRGEAKLFGHLADFSFELHERFAHLLDLFLAEGASFHPADGLAFEQLPQEIDQSQNELGQALLDIVGRKFDARGDGCGFFLKRRRIAGLVLWRPLSHERLPLPRIHWEAMGQ